MERQQQPTVPLMQYDNHAFDDGDGDDGVEAVVVVPHLY